MAIQYLEYVLKESDTFLLPFSDFMLIIVSWDVTPSQAACRSNAF